MSEEAGTLLMLIGFFVILYVPHIHLLNQILKGLDDMADLEAQALADISAAIDSAVALIEKLAAAAATAVPPVDHSAEIEALKAKLSGAVSAASPAPAAPAAPAA